jgi:2-polyprenyl-3-methyl-5-hydroxy-6-metoxy-1,4-benzoquinol methylase
MIESNEFMLNNNIMLNPYEEISRVYDTGWGDFSIQYVPLIEELLGERYIKRARILDIACGTGILALELARHGHTVHGTDVSTEMIKIAKKKVAGLPNLSFAVQDMTRFSTKNKFDIVTCTFDSINYLRRLHDVRKMLCSVASALNTGGLFIFDSNTRYLYMRHANELDKREINGEEFLHQCKYSPRGNVATTAFSFSDGTYEVHKQRPYSYDELQPLLDKAGLRTLHLFSWFNRLPYSSNTPKFFCVAEKGRELL